MAKAKAKAKKGKGGKGGGGKAGGSGLRWGGRASPADRRLNTVLAVAAVILVAAGAAYWWQQSRVGARFETRAAAGEAALQGVTSEPSRGRRHLSAGESFSYGARFPTSGPHAATPTPPGFYEEARPATRLVHALEHGNVVVYYDAPGPQALQTLRNWAALFGGDWDGLVAVPAPGLGEAVVLTAWTKRLHLERFDPAAAAAFIDAYRGRGPENPVR